MDKNLFRAARIVAGLAGLRAPLTEEQIAARAAASKALATVSALHLLQVLVQGRPSGLDPFSLPADLAPPRVYMDSEFPSDREGRAGGQR
jgi:hypothetical protein